MEQSTRVDQTESTPPPPNPDDLIRPIDRGTEDVAPGELTYGEDVHQPVNPAIPPNLVI